jgi:[acyl-carrier-protein] S-malonyltransferase
MTKTAWVFPGQGSQTVGMCRDIYDNVASARGIFEEADRALGFALSKLCFEGPEEELRQTVNAQPALVTAAYACLEAAWEINGDKLATPAFTAGHSLGEYTALAASGVFDFTTAVRLARERGRLMHEAGQRHAGGMAAIIGLEETKLVEVCRQSNTIIANINCPGQIVITGAIENIGKAMELAKAAGAIRAIPLQVSGAFHSELMESIVAEMSAIVRSSLFKDPIIPVVANMTALPLTKAEAVKEELINQLTNTVLWQRGVEYMVAQGVDTFIEIGPGKVLTGLIRRINRDVATLNINDLATAKSIGV